MVFAPTATSIGWQARSEVANSSSSSLNDHDREYPSWKGKKKGVRCKEKVVRSDVRSDQKPSKKKRTRDKQNFDIGRGERKKIQHCNADSSSGGKAFEKNYTDSSCNDNFIAPGVKITEHYDEEYHSILLTFESVGRDENRSQSVVLIGTAKVMAIEGNVTIFGYTLTSKSGLTIALNSPSWTSSMCITPCLTKSHTGTQIPQTKDFAKPSIEASSQLPIKVKITSTKSYKNEGRTFRITTPEKVRSHIFISDNWNLTANAILNDVTRHVKKNILECNGIDSIKVSKHAHQDAVSRDNRNSNRILVCGAKGVGKSTYLRYLVNRFLSAATNGLKCSKGAADDNAYAERVAIIDCDVGQPELSPPGLLSLTIVKKPILSPPNAHMICGGNVDTHSSSNIPDIYEEEEKLFDVADNHCKAYYFGYTSSKADPTSYITAVKALVADYEALCNDGQVSISNYCSNRIPLIINTDGWVKSMGYEILSSIIDATDPEHIVQILGSSKAKSFALSSHDSYLRQIHNIEAFGFHMGADCTFTSQPQNEPIVPDPIMDFTIPQQSFQPTNTTNYTEVKGFNSSVTSMSLRNLSLCTYFLGGYSSFLRTGATFQNSIVDDEHMISTTLANFSPFAVPFNAINCAHLDDRITNSTRNNVEHFRNIANSINCSIVGLCVGKAQYKVSNECVGLGIIRGIDWQKKLFYILTPVPVCKIVGHVQTIVVGHVQLPIECVNLGSKSESFIYQCCDGISVAIGNGSKIENKR